MSEMIQSSDRNQKPENTKHQTEKPVNGKSTSFDPLIKSEQQTAASSTRNDWRWLMYNDRMAVDCEFEDQVGASRLSITQWNMIMTAVTFEIEGPQEPETARLSSNLETVPSVLSELDGRSANGQSGTSVRFFKSIVDAVPKFLASDHESVLEEIRQLVRIYSNELEFQLKEQGKWKQMCEIAAREES